MRGLRGSHIPFCRKQADDVVFQSGPTLEKWRRHVGRITKEDEHVLDDVRDCFLYL